MSMEAVAVVDKFQEAFDELEAQKTLIDSCTQTWKRLFLHFSSLERSLAEREQALESRIGEIDSKAARSLEALSQRESAIPARESAAASLVEKRRDAAISEMEASSSESSFDILGSLRGYCRRMDSVGLWQFMVSRRQDMSIPRREISDAVAEAVDPARLILDGVKDSIEHQDEGAGTGDRWWACSMLLGTLIVKDGTKIPEIPRSIKEKAESLAISWKKKVQERKENSPTSAAEGQLFLQLIGAFSLQSAIEEDFLKKLIADSASMKEIPKLAASFGLGEKLRDVVEELIKRGKDIEAASIAHEVGLSDEFSPINLLQSYLQTSRRNANAILKNGNHSLSATEESSNLELCALRSIIECVESLELEKEFSLESPKKRVEMLEMAREERKKTYGKRARVGGPSTLFRPTKAGRSSSRRQSVEYIPPPRRPYKPHGLGPSQQQPYYVPEEVGGPRRSMVYAAAPPSGYGGYEYSGGAHQGEEGN